MKYVLGILGIILVAVFAIFLITRGGGDEPEDKPKEVVVSQQNNPNTSAVMTQQGKLLGEDERRAIRISVTQSERRLDVLTGYGEAVESSQVFANTPEAYENFLIALDKAGYEQKRETSNTDERGSCPLGRTYIYELKEFSQDLIRLWDTTCGQKIGTFNGDQGTVRKLFQEQIPDYSKKVENVDLMGTKADPKPQQ